MSAFNDVEASEHASSVALFASPDLQARGPEKNTWDYFNNRQRWTLVFVLFLIASSGSIDRAILVIMLEPIKREFHVSDTALGLLSGVSFGIFYAILGLPIARYADRGDRRLLITLSLGLWSIFTVGCGLARSFLQLFIMRIGVGVGEAGGTGPPLMSLLADYFPPEQRARAIGFIQVSTVSGAVFGLIGGSIIAQLYGWRTTLYVAGLPGVLLSLVAWFALREPRKRTGVVVSNTGGEGFMEAFRALMKKPTFVYAALAYVSFQFVANGAFTFASAFVVRVLRQPLGEAGGVAGALSTVSVLAGNLLGGVLAAKLSKRDMAWLCKIPGYGMLFALPFYAASFLSPSLIGYTALSAIGGVFMLGCIPPILTTMLVVVGAPRRATGLTIAHMGASIVGVTCGPIVAGMLSDFLGHWLGPAEGLRWGLILSLLGFLPAGYFMLRSGRTIHADLED